MELCCGLLAARGTAGTMAETRFPWYSLTLLFPVPRPPAAWPVPTYPPISGPHMASSHPPRLPHTPAPGPPGWLLKLNLPGSRAPKQEGQWLDESGTEKMG